MDEPQSRRSLLNEGQDSQYEPTLPPSEHAESFDSLYEDGSSEELDAVDDNLQEAPKPIIDDYEASAAEQQ